jgi:hypothetical protein
LLEFIHRLGEFRSVTAGTGSNHIVGDVSPPSIEGHDVIKGAFPWFKPDGAVMTARVVSDKDGDVDRGESTEGSQPFGFAVDGGGESNQFALERRLSHSRTLATTGQAARPLMKQS